MSFARIAAIVTAASLMCWGNSAYAAGPIRAFHAGLWSGGAYLDDRTGDFTHCSAGVAYDSGINMFILVTGGYRWWLGFIDPRWSFAPNEKLPVELRFGNGPRLAMAGTAPNRLIVLVPLPDDPRLIDSMGRSRELNLIAAGQSFFFNLGGVSAVTAELKDCVRGSLALHEPAPAASSTISASAPTFATITPTAAPASIGPSSPAAPPIAIASPHPMPAVAPTSADATSGTAPRPTAVPSTDESAKLAIPKPPAAPVTPASSPATPMGEMLQTVPATGVEEVRLAQEFFSTAQLPHAHLVVSDRPAALANFTAVWRSDDAAGAVKIIPPGPNVSGIGIASDLLAVDPRMCRGNFASTRTSADIDGKLVFSAALSCSEGNERRTAEYFITPRGKGGFVVFAVVGSSAAYAIARSDQPRIDMFSRAAARAASNGS